MLKFSSFLSLQLLTSLKIHGQLSTTTATATSNVYPAIGCWSSLGTLQLHSKTSAPKESRWSLFDAGSPLLSVRNNQPQMSSQHCPEPRSKYSSPFVLAQSRVDTLTSLSILLTSPRILFTSPFPCLVSFVCLFV